MTTPKEDYEHNSHIHCFDQKTLPCGLGGYHCCLCDIVTSGKAPKDELPEWETETKKYIDELAYAIRPSNQVMEVTRLLRKTLPSLIQLVRNLTLEEAAEAADHEETRQICLVEEVTQEHDKSLHTYATGVSVMIAHTIRSLKK